MNYVEDLDLFFKVLFFIISWPFPADWHSKFWPILTVCYLKGQIPVNILGKLDLACLNGMDWGMLPIESLWPHIIDPYSGVQPLLLDHCEDLKLKQILWIAENDPCNRKFILENGPCMQKIDWTGLDLNDYRTILPELEIQSISNNFDDISPEIIIEGLSRSNFIFKSSQHLCQFLHKIPLEIFSFPEFTSNPQISNLFQVNCFLKSNHLIPSMARILFSHPQHFSNFQVTEFKDLLETFQHENSPEFLLKIDEILSNSSHCLLNEVDFDFDFTNFHSSLQTRNLEFFIENHPQTLKRKYDLGPFDQYRILQIILCSCSNNLILFSKYFDEQIFDDWLVSKFLKDYPKILKEILYPAKNITSIPLLRFLCLKADHHQQNDFVFKCNKPLLVPQAHEIKSLEALKATLRLIKPSQIASNDFRIEFANDAVVDMGGPLLDWINEILRLFLDFDLFEMAKGDGDNDHKAEALIFLDPELFKYLGLLHGKLVQIHSGPGWIPTINDEIISKIESLFNLRNNPEEAIKLFNDFNFPSLRSSPLISHQVNNLSEIEAYFALMSDHFFTWKTRSWSKYQEGLKYFIQDSVPESLVKALLLPSKPPTASQIISMSTIQPDQEIQHNLFEIWTSILTSFTPFELVKLLIFITGQGRLSHLTVQFHQVPKPKLPQSKTCISKLFLFTLPFSDAEAMTDHLAQALKISIFNYQGFGNI